MLTRFRMILLLSAVCACVTAPKKDRELISADRLAMDRQSTLIFKLGNGIPIVYRQIGDSDIAHLRVNFLSGQADMPIGQKSLPAWYWSTAILGAEQFSKAEIHKIEESYGLDLNCSEGLELSSCHLETLNEDWDKVLPLFGAILRSPSLLPEDAALTKKRLLHKLRRSAEEPGTMVNDVVNQVFYPPDHPYRLTVADNINELSNLNEKLLGEYGTKIRKAENMFVVFTGHLPQEKLQADLEKILGSIPKGEVNHAIANAPAFSAQNFIAFEDRPIPTAYLRFKVPTPGVSESDAVATQLLFSILDHEMGMEIRTRRSLSYEAHAFTLQYSMGIGGMSLSTSRPREALDALDTVIARVKQRRYSDAELERFKTTFITSYFLRQETHESAAQTLALAQRYFGNPLAAYETPNLLAKVNAADIQRLATTILRDFRVGVVFDRKKFDTAWLDQFSAHHRPKESH